MASTPYDEVLYPSYTYPQTHPDRLATLAKLFGMSPAPVEHCRVLELGCGAGGNIISFAFDLEQSEMVGVDQAGSAIAEGNELISALGLKNITLKQMDLLEMSDDLGEFDYILAHGLYSWVPPRVQDRILAICQKHLTRQGVAYISYNAYPGCHLRDIARDLMLFHTRDTLEPQERLAQSRAVVKWAAEAQSQKNTYSMWLQEFDKRIPRKSDGSLYHDDLSEVNAPVYFHRFTAHAAKYGLQFLSEADYFETENYFEFPQEVQEQIHVMARQNLLAKEQYLDFLKGRSFRQTLICRSEVVLERPIKAERIKELLIRSSASPVSSAPDIKGKSIEEFRTKKDAAASTDLPLAKAAFVYLGSVYPRAVSLAELVESASELISQERADSQDIDTIAEVVLKSFGAGVLELHSHEPRFSVEPGRFPVASPLARLQAQKGEVVTTLLHDSMRLADSLGLELLQLLDGTRDREALTQELSRLIQQNMERLEPAASGEAKEAQLEAIPEELEAKLVELGKLGLLLA